MKMLKIILSNIYKGLKSLFLFFMLIFILSIALIFMVLDQDLGIEYEQSVPEEESKSKNLKNESDSKGEYEDEDETSKSNDKSSLEEEKKLFHIIQNNLEAFYKNKFEAEYPNHQVSVVTLSLQEQEELQLRLAEFSSFLESYLKNKSEEDSEDMEAIIGMFFSSASNSATSSPVSTTSTVDSEFMKIVGLIGEGKDVVIHSPSTPGSSHRENIDSPQGTEESVSKPVTPSSSYAEGETQPRKPVIIVTRKVEEGEPIPPLPGWGHLQSTDPDYEVKRIINLKRFIRDYDNSHKLPSNTPSNRNQEWMENESYGLESLFKEDEQPKK